MNYPQCARSPQWGRAGAREAVISMKRASLPCKSQESVFPAGMNEERDGQSELLYCCVRGTGYFLTCKGERPSQQPEEQTGLVSEGSDPVFISRILQTAGVSFHLPDARKNPCQRGRSYQLPVILRLQK